MVLLIKDYFSCYYIFYYYEHDAFIPIYLTPDSCQ